MATGIPLRIKSAPKTPNAGSILIMNGMVSSPSFQGSVAFAIVPFPFPSTVVLLVDPSEKVVELTVKVNTKVVGEAEREPEAVGVTREVMVVVIT